MAKELTKDERIIVRGYKEGLKNIRKDINLLYEKHAKDGKLSAADLSKYNRLTNLEKNIADNLKTAYDVQVRTTKKAVKGAFESAFYYGTFELEQEAKMNLMFGLLKKEAVNAVVEGPNRWPQIAKGHTKLTNAKIRDQIMQGVVQGKDAGQVTKAIAKEMNIAASKACRIVRTETHRAQNQGSLDSYTEAYKKGVLIQKVWVATLDDRTRDSHRVMDGQVVEVYEDFIMPGDIKASAPGLSGSASGDINCRCTIRAEVVGFTPQARRARGDGIIPQQTYQQWAKAKGIKFDDKMADEVKKLLEARAAKIAQVGDINLNTIYNEFEPELLPYAPTQAEHKCLMDTGSIKDMINNKTKFSNYMVDFTAGESGFSQLSTKILKGEHNFKGTLTNDEAFALNVLRLIDEAPQRSAPIYRLEELASHNKNLKEGDTIIYGMRSFSRSKEWVNRAVAGEYDVDFSSPVLLEVKNCRAINVKPFSYFKEQEESLTAGHFKISSVKNMKIKGQNVKHIVLEQTRVLKGIPFDKDMTDEVKKLLEVRGQTKAEQAAVKVAKTDRDYINRLDMPAAEIKEGLDKIYKDYYAETLNKEHIEAIERYRGSGYVIINSYLRGIDKEMYGGEIYTKVMNGLLDAIEKVKIKEDMIVTRGTTIDWLGGLKWEELKPGQIVVEDGFMSTSVRGNIGEEFAKLKKDKDAAVLIEAKVNKGTNGVFVDTVVNEIWEKNMEGEIILKPGARFIVEEKWIDENGIKRLKGAIMSER